MQKFKHIILSNLTTGIFIIFLLVITFNPSAKAFLLEGLMKIGLFQPSIKETSKEIAPNMIFRNAENQKVSLEELKGKVVFINFWATWCPPCIAEMPSIHGFYQQFNQEQNLVFLMVDVDDNFQKSQQFMDKRKLNLPIVQMASQIPDNFISNSIPTTLVLDKKGRVVFRQEGGADYGNQKFIAFIRQLLKENEAI